MMKATASNTPSSTPPVGWLAFLFTDIEGSTQLYERIGEFYREVLQRHNELLRAEFARHGGYEVKDTGDGFLAVFAEPRDAVACSISAQRALFYATWPEIGGPLRTRMAIHWGEAFFQNEAYCGIALHHASRALSAANGGQTLCTDALVAKLPDEARSDLRNAGLHRLRDVAEPVRLFEVVFPEMRESLPPRAAPAFTHNLPVASTRFFGREEEIGQLTTRLLPEAPDAAPRRAGRLVTMLGPGGTGKTRLALTVAEKLLRSYDHAVWFIPLADLREPALLPETIRSALRLPDEPGIVAVEQVTKMLGAQPALVILDNFEQLIEGGAQFVDAFLKRLPRLVCLVTSRQRLDLSGECEFLLNPLGTPARAPTFEEICASPSVQLFLDRAGAARHDFELTPENAGDAAELCRALEGMPLALELAAARTGLLTPQQMLSRLAHRLDFLAGGRRDLPLRHRTLRATIAWSYELLSPAFQEVFARLSIFCGGWSLEAAEATAFADTSAGPGRVLDALTELRGCSLLLTEEREGEMRYRMLEVIREFAAERLAAAGAASEVAEKHRHFFHTFARISDANEAVRFRNFEAEHDNLRAVLSGEPVNLQRASLAVALQDFWMIRGYVSEGCRWIRQIMEAPLPDEQRAVLNNNAGILAWKSGDLVAARADMESAMAHWLTQSDQKKVAKVLNNLGILACEQGDHPAAQTFYQRALEIYRELHWESETAAVLSNFGALTLSLGNVQDARSMLEESLHIQRRLGEQFNCANTLHNLAESEHLLGDFAEARRRFAESLHLRQALGNQGDMHTFLQTLAEMAVREGRLELGVSLSAAALSAASRLGDRLAAELRQKLNADLDTFRTAVGSGRFEQCWIRGSDLDVNEVLGADGEWKMKLDPLTARSIHSGP